MAKRQRAKIPGLAQRLSDSIRIWSQSDEPNVRSFVSALGETPGASRTTMYRYLNGDLTPPVELLIKAAEILGVSLEWLVTGKGERTPRAYPKLLRYHQVTGQTAAYILDTLFQQKLPAVFARLDRPAYHAALHAAEAISDGLHPRAIAVRSEDEALQLVERLTDAITSCLDSLERVLSLSDTMNARPNTEQVIRFVGLYWHAVEFLVSRAQWAGLGTLLAKNMGWEHIPLPNSVVHKRLKLVDGYKRGRSWRYSAKTHLWGIPLNG